MTAKWYVCWKFKTTWICYLKGDDKSFMVDQIVAYKWSGGSGLKVRRQSDTRGPVRKRLLIFVGIQSLTNYNNVFYFIFIWVFFFSSQIGSHRIKKKKTKQKQTWGASIFQYRVCFVCSLLQLLSFSPALLKNQNGLGVE